MSEQQDALEDLESSGVLAALAWANASAYRRTMEDYDPDTGHDQGWVGSTAHRLFVDRLHRAFSTGRHRVDSPESASAGLDLVAAGLAPGEHRKMPLITPGVVVWSDLNQSPGWRCGDWRFLLTSFVYGESNRIPWPQKSSTKQRVASQGKPVGWLDPQPTLFDNDPDSLVAAIQALREEEEEPNATTLIIAHSIERELNIRELYLGRSRLNRGGGDAWYWKHDLLATSLGTPAMEPIPASPGPRPGLPSIQDAPVRLRRQSSEGGGEHQASGENDK
ncbi:hypothetical protein [Streptomyces reniochalinae]|uniref:Uncharacterized protein n=1 Tax=Streptomyces reniochalinae TaxID=2250578 RepID=A0A367F3T1_9ACTN|nr:hypothetical protein [Streptomyces reniochalinae]RCG24160.1 hypothetical protein DQ392_03185 [Streptomyces reniochalinae]